MVACGMLDVAVADIRARYLRVDDMSCFASVFYARVLFVRV